MFLNNLIKSDYLNFQYIIVIKNFVINKSWVIMIMIMNMIKL